MITEETLKERAREAMPFCEEHNLISWADKENNKFFPKALMALSINKMEYYLNPHPSLDKLMMSDGIHTTEEWLQTQPPTWRAIETEAIYECVKRGWSLHIMNIQSVAREIDAMRNPKGW